MIFTAAVEAQCVSDVTVVSTRSSRPRFLEGPTAWNGSILAVAGSEIDKEEFQILLFDENGNLLYPSQPIRADGEGLIDVLWNGQEFAVFYETEGDLGITRINSEGTIIGPRIVRIADVDLAEDEDIAIVWSPTAREYLVARSVTGAERVVRATWLERDGSIRSEEDIDTAADGSFVRAAVNATGKVGVFYIDDRTTDVNFVAIDEDSTARPKRVWDNEDNLIVVGRADHFAMFREDVVGSGKRIGEWQVIDTSGEEVRHDSRLLLGTQGDVELLYAVGLENEYALSYLEWPDGIDVGEPHYRLARFGFDEEPISDTLFAASHRTRRRHERSENGFVWTGRSFLSLGSRDNDDPDDTYLIRYCPLRAEIAAPRIARRDEVITFHSVVDGGVPLYTYEWDWNDTDRATGPQVTLSFSTAGEHRVRLTVTDSTGIETTTDFIVTVSGARRRAVKK